MSTPIKNDCTCTICCLPANAPIEIDASEYLHCKRMFEFFGPSGVMATEEGHEFFEEKQWWLLFEPHAKPWITAAIKAGEVESPMEAWFGASCLVSVCFDAFDGKRTWLELTGYELLFENIGHGGLLEGWSIRQVVLGMRSFMAYLGARDIVDALSAAHIKSELASWEERIVAYFDDDGPWCMPDSETQRLRVN